MKIDERILADLGAVPIDVFSVASCSSSPSDLSARRPRFHHLVVNLALGDHGLGPCTGPAISLTSFSRAPMTLPSVPAPHVLDRRWTPGPGSSSAKPDCKAVGRKSPFFAPPAAPKDDCQVADLLLRQRLFSSANGRSPAEGSPRAAPRPPTGLERIFAPAGPRIRSMSASRMLTLMRVCSSSAPSHNTVHPRPIAEERPSPRPLICRGREYQAQHERPGSAKRSTDLRWTGTGLLDDTSAHAPRAAFLPPRQRGHMHRQRVAVEVAFERSAQKPADACWIALPRSGRSRPDSGRVQASSARVQRTVSCDDLVQDVPHYGSPAISTIFLGGAALDRGGQPHQLSL